MTKRSRRTKSTAKKKSTRKSYSRKRSRQPDWRASLFRVFRILIVLGVLAFLIYLIVHKFWLQPSDSLLSPEPEQQTVNLNSLPKDKRFDYQINELFRRHELLDGWINRTGKTIKVRLPVDFSSIILVHEIINLARDFDYELLDSRENIALRQYAVQIGHNGKLLRKFILKQEAGLKRNRGRIAIIIDDFGYADNEQINKLLALPQIITCAVIPGLPRSKSIYEEIRNHGKPTLIHMPMEATNEKVEYSDYTIYASMTGTEIARRVRKAILDFPESQGLNNHMGSKVTADAQAMKAVLNELKRHGKFFIDSKTRNASIGFQLARELKVPTAARDIFLERKRNDSKDYLKKKLKAVAKIAETTGSAIAIGHPYNNTIEVLLDQIPKFERNGFDFVAVSELVK